VSGINKKPDRVLLSQVTLARLWVQWQLYRGTVPDYQVGLVEDDVCSLEAFGACFDIEADCLTFGQCLEAIALNGLEVNKYVGAAVVLSQKAEAFGFVKPLYSTCSHGMFPLFKQLKMSLRLQVWRMGIKK